MVIADGNREALAIEIGMSIPSARVIRVLDDLIRLEAGPGRCASTLLRSSWPRTFRQAGADNLASPLEKGCR